MGAGAGSCRLDFLCLCVSECPDIPTLLLPLEMVGTQHSKCVQNTQNDQGAPCIAHLQTGVTQKEWFIEFFLNCVMLFNKVFGMTSRKLLMGGPWGSLH